MASKEIYRKRLKVMQETAGKLVPTPKSVTKEISLAPQPEKSVKKEADCQF